MSAIALILAAGEGTRMKSDLPKVAHEILGVPLVGYVVRAARAAECEPMLVVGHCAGTVEALVPGVKCVRQDEQLGTGHAVMCAEEALTGFGGSLVILSGDSPLMRPETMRALVSAREASGAAVALLTAHMSDPAGYGRVFRDTSGGIERIVEEKDLGDELRSMTEVNTGTYCFDARVLFDHLHRLNTDNAQGEYYLTDMVGVFASEGLGVAAVTADDALETMGVNTRVQLAEASAAMQARINETHMLAGVTMVAPQMTWVGPDVSICRDVVLEPMTSLMGSTFIADGAVIGPGSRVVDTRVGEGAVIDSSVVLGSEIGPRATVGPMAYIRPGTVMAAGAKAGASVEIKNSRIGEGSKVPHLSYIGDADIGKNVNVGAGTITCNYDGERKHATTIGDGAFIGSDTMLVAPVEIGEGAVTGAGSAIAKDVPPLSLGIERCEQRNIEGWAERRHAREADEGEAGQESGR